MPDEPSAAPDRLVGFDGLRGISILAVMICHSDPREGVTQMLGPWGVTTFFGVSGFLITRNLLQEVNRTGRVDARAFWTKRFAKLVPSLMLLLVAVWLLGWFTPTGCAPPAFVLAALFGTALLPGHTCWYLAHTASLSVEECFYVACVVILMVSARRPRMIRVAFLALAVSPILRVLNHIRRTPATMAALGHYHAIPVIECFDIFVIMGFAAYALERWGASLRTGVVEDRIGRCVAEVVRRTPIPAAIGAEIAGEFVMDRTGSLVAIALVPTLKALVLAILSLRLVLGLERGAVGRVLELRPLKYLGLLSYSLYLAQQVFLTHGAPPILGLGLETFPLSWVATIGLAAANYHWFEEPMRHRIRRALLPRRRALGTTELGVSIE